MADAVLQPRIRDLLLYTQLDPEDPNYIDPSTISVVLDHDDWDKSKRYPLSEILSSVSISTTKVGKLSDLSSRSVTVVFDTPFASSSIKEHVEVYRYKSEGGVYEREDILYHFASAGWFSTTGFSLVIEDSEDLTGIIVSYEFIQIP
jgi:hypothetical protein